MPQMINSAFNPYKAGMSSPSPVGNAPAPGAPNAAPAPRFDTMGRMNPSNPFARFDQMPQLPGQKQLPGPTDIKAYTVDPSELTRLNVSGMNMNPYRSQALNDLSASSASSLAGAQSQLAQTGGLSASDRMKLASQFNRDKILGRQQALGKYAGMEAQSAMDADKANQMYNAQLLNENLYANAQAQQRAEELQRQLQASGAMADATMAQANKSPGGLLGGKLIPGIL